jgi:hypothetical protein
VIAAQFQPTPVEAWAKAVAEAVWLPDKNQLPVFAALVDAYEVLVSQDLTDHERRTVGRWWERLLREIAYRARRARAELAVIDWKYRVIESNVGATQA